MKPKAFLQQLDEQRLLAAIAEGEERCSGEIRVYVSRQHHVDVRKAAEEQFVKLGMMRTRERNGVLIFLAPGIQQFAILGDRGIHEKVGAGFWEEVSAGMSAQLKAGRYTEALVGAIESVGLALATHFPPQRDDRNELPNEITGD